MISKKLRNLWLWWSGFYYLWVARLKGASTVVEIFWPPKQEPKVVATSVLGYQLKVYCQKKHYARVYSRALVPTRHHVHYHIYSTVSDDAPAALKEACEIVMSISSGTHWSVDADYQEKMAVDAYLDLLAAQLRRTQPHAFKAA